MRHLLLFALFVTSPIQAAGETAQVRKASSPPTGWIAIQPPKDEADWRCANHSPDEWQVTAFDNDRLLITPQDAGEMTSLAVEGGTLVGLDHGEFGGSLEWEPAGQTKRMLIHKCNPVALISAGGTVFLASGLTHMGTNRGEILRVDRASRNRWSVTKVLTLEAAARAVGTVRNNAALVLTATGLLKVDFERLAIQPIFRNANWLYLYGRSVAEFDNSIFIGSRRAVIRLRRDSNTLVEEWWVPEGCRRMTGKDCECQR